MRSLFLLLLVLTFSACATATTAPTQALEIGSTKAEVRASYGKPLGVSLNKGLECVTYKGPTKAMGWDTPRRETVIFVHYQADKVVSYSPPKPIPSYSDAIPTCELD